MTGYSAVLGTGANDAVAMTDSEPKIAAAITATTRLLPHVTTVATPTAIATHLHGPPAILAVALPGRSTRCPAAPSCCGGPPAPSCRWRSAVRSRALPLPATLTIPATMDPTGLHLLWQGLSLDDTVGLQTSNPALEVLR